MLAFSSFPVALCLLMCSPAAQNFEITCPPSGFKVGEPATVTCAVNKTAFETTCIRPPALLKFHFTPSNGVQNEWCTANYSLCNGTGVADRLCGKCSCGCKEVNENLIIHRLEFIPTAEHAAGSFSCAVVCLQSGNLPPLTKSNCDRVTVAPPPDASGAGTTAPPPDGSGGGTTAPPPGGSGAGTTGAMPWFISALSAVALALNGFSFLI